VGGLLTELWYVFQFIFTNDTLIGLFVVPHAVLKLPAILWQFLSNDACPSWNVPGRGAFKKYSLTNLELITGHSSPPKTESQFTLLAPCCQRLAEL
jgi:hypothetical protein